MSRQSIVTFVVLSLLLGALVLASTISGVRLYDRIATNICVMLILTVGLQIFMGNSGILSFAHIGFMGIGAYASAVLTIPAQVKGMSLPDLYPILAGTTLPVPLAILVGGLVAAAVAAIVSFPLMRLSDAAAVITSFALLVVIYTVLTNWSEVTNGPRTLFGLPKFTTLPAAALAAWAAIAIALVFKDSRSGRLLRASRDDEVAAAALGANIPALRWQAFILAAFIAGVGGALWGHFITSFSPKAFYLKEKFLVISMLVIGGAGTVSGAVTGTLVVSLAYEELRALEGALNSAKITTSPVVGLTEIVLALAMIAVMILRPGGLVGSREFGALFRRRP